MSVLAAITVDLEALPPDLATSGLAETALVLARELDDPDAGAAAKASCARALLDVLEAVGVLTPAQEVTDSLDDLAGRREARLEAS